MKTLIIAVLALTLVGCSPTPAEKDAAYARAQQLDANAPAEKVGLTPDGQTILRMTITAVPPECVGCTSPGRPHYVYFVGNVVTVNGLVSENKSSRQTVNVTITEPMSLTDAKTRIDQMLKDDQTRKLDALRKGH